MDDVTKKAIERLANGETVSMVGIGNSMTPMIKSRQTVVIAPVAKEDIQKGDAVLCKVLGFVYIHKVTGIKRYKTGKWQFQISNNHGHINGWTTLVYGKVIEVL